MARSRIRVAAWSSMVAGFILLLWPIAPDTPLWDMPGVFGGGRSPAADVVTPIGAFISGESLLDGGNRLQLAVGLLLLGVSLGAWLASTSRPNATVPTDRPRVPTQL